MTDFELDAIMRWILDGEEQELVVIFPSLTVAHYELDSVAYMVMDNQPQLEVKRITSESRLKIGDKTIRAISLTHGRVILNVFGSHRLWFHISSSTRKADLRCDERRRLEEIYNIIEIQKLKELEV